MKLNEFYSEWASNGIFKNLENIGLEWDLDDYSILDIEYIGGRSGLKEINPLLNNLVRNENRYQVVTNIIKVRFLQKWNKLYATLSFNYNPISNYDMTESSSDTNVNTSTAVGTSSSEGKVSAFNTNTYENDNKVEGSNNNSVSSNGTITHTMTRSGNIGTTTSQSMVMSERSVLMWNYFEQVFADLDDLLCLKVYGEVEYVANVDNGLNREEVQRLINSTLEDGNYTTEEDVENIITGKGYVTASEVETIVEEYTPYTDYNITSASVIDNTLLSAALLLNIDGNTEKIDDRFYCVGETRNLNIKCNDLQVSIPLDNPLCKIDDSLQDKLVLRSDGTGYIDRKCGWVDLSTLTWTKSSSQTHGFTSQGLSDYLYSENVRVICDKYEYGGTSSTISNLDGDVTAIYLRVHQSVFTRSIYLIDVDHTTLPTPSDNWLQGILVYELAQPTIIELTAEQIKEIYKLKTFDGSTTIEALTDCECEFSVRVAKNVKGAELLTAFANSAINQQSNVNIQSTHSTMQHELTNSITSDILTLDTNVTDISNLKEVDLDD